MSHVFITSGVCGNCRQKWPGLTFQGAVAWRRPDILLLSSSSSKILRNNGPGTSSIACVRKYAIIIDRFIIGWHLEDFDLLDKACNFSHMDSAKHLLFDSSPPIDLIESKFGTTKKTKLLNRLLLNWREKPPVHQCASKDT